jgi:hypothetical protein
LLPDEAFFEESPLPDDGLEEGEPEDPVESEDPDEEPESEEPEEEEESEPDEPEESLEDFASAAASLALLAERVP